MERGQMLAAGSAGGGIGAFTLRLLEYISNSIYDTSCAVPPHATIAPVDVPVSIVSLESANSGFHIFLDYRILIAFALGICFWPVVEFISVARRLWSRWLRSLETSYLHRAVRP